jgi:hypothetical protein
MIYFKTNSMINKKLLLLVIFFLLSNVIFAQQVNKERVGLPKKSIIINAEGRPDIITRQEQFDKQNAEMSQFHHQAELAKQAREIEFKKQEMELLVAKQKAEEKQLALQKKETIFYLCVIICLIFFSVLSFIFYKNNFKNKLK